ncbi:hypothetical protein GGI17_001548 [Coemansia sp. S146]|nr:hypothetical protein GGI17_001548 [Coemansia sp. S146]
MDVVADRANSDVDETTIPKTGQPQFSPEQNLSFYETIREMFGTVFTERNAIAFEGCHAAIAAVNYVYEAEILAANSDPELISISESVHSTVVNDPKDNTLIGLVSARADAASDAIADVSDIKVVGVDPSAKSGAQRL